MSAPNPLNPPSQSRKLLAPVWHTVVLILIVFATSFFQSRRMGHVESDHVPSRVALYSFTICFELVLLAYVWFLGIRPTGTKFKEVIGGRWASAREVWRDIGVACLFWIVVVVFLVLSGHILGKNSDMNRVFPIIMPRGPLEMTVWVLLSISAGFCEEFVFRGYLQKQFLALTGSDAAAIAVQAIIFGAAHQYQGVKGMLSITIYGALFGVLAKMRNSLRPGMIQHTLQDSSAGILLSLASKYFPKPA
jgi:membrane protease YdiL (CAAX protease family)